MGHALDGPRDEGPSGGLSVVLAVLPGITQAPAIASAGAAAAGHDTRR